MMAPIFAVLTAFALAQPVTAPDSWTLLLRSAAAKDKTLVASIEKMQRWNACAEWGHLYRSNKDERREHLLVGFLQSEHFLNDQDLGHVRDATVAIGMTECGVFASNGRPERVNNTETAKGRTAQLVYGNTYVYTQTASGPMNVVYAIQY